jgi:hypothetical protein
MASLLLTGIFRSPPESTGFRERLSGAIDRIRGQRATTYSAGPFLVVRRQGDCGYNEGTQETDGGDFVVAFDAIDARDLFERGRQACANVTAAILSSVDEIESIQRVSETVIGIRDDGRRLYSYTATMGRATAILSRQLTDEIVHAIETNYSNVWAEAGHLRTRDLLRLSFESHSDPLRQFLGAWWAMEALLARERGTMSQKFASLSTRLSLGTTAEDIANFERVRGIRNALVHSGSEEQLGNNARLVRDLVLKYLHALQSSS